jgi:5-methylthioribose kinase
LHVALGFVGVKMIRRILGLAHVAELEAILDPDLRARCERKALRIGRLLVVNAEVSLRLMK